MYNTNSISMKTSVKIIINKARNVAMATTLAIFLAACGEKQNKKNASEDVESSIRETVDMTDAAFSDGMTGKVFQNYQQIRVALVNSDADDVQVAAGNMAENFAGEHEDVKSMALAMADTDDLKEQRELFSELTGKVEPIFKETISEGTIYKQFCPMAFKGEGGYWISSVEKIRNPYYGEKMLKCGKVVAKIQ